MVLISTLSMKVKEDDITRNYFKVADFKLARCENLAIQRQSCEIASHIPGNETGTFTAVKKLTKPPLQQEHTKPNLEPTPTPTITKTVSTF